MVTKPSEYTRGEEFLDKPKNYNFITIK